MFGCDASVRVPGAQHPAWFDVWLADGFDGDARRSCIGRVGARLRCGAVSKMESFFCVVVATCIATVRRHDRAVEKYHKSQIARGGAKKNGSFV